MASIQQLAAPYTLSLPTPSGNLVGFTNPTGMLEEISAPPFVSSSEGTFMPYFVAYLYDTWLKTAGWNNFDFVSDPFNISGVDHFSVSPPELRRVRLSFNAESNVGVIKPGTPPSGNYGLCQFKFGGFVGRLRRISFQQSIFEPEAEGATDFQYYLPDGMEAQAVYYQADQPPAQLQYGSGSHLNPDNNDVNAGGGSFSGLSGPEATASTNQQIPVIGAGSVLGINTNHHVQHDFNSVVTVAQFPWRGLVQALINEIWQIAAHPTRGTNNSGALSYDGCRVYSSGSNIIKAASVSVSIPVGTSNFQFGATGAVYVGAWAPVVNGFMGEMQYLNATSNWLTGLPRDCTGIWLFLKPGITGSINLITAPSVVQNSDSDYGNINLQGGLTAGLIYG